MQNCMMRRDRVMAPIVVLGAVVISGEAFAQPANNASPPGKDPQQIAYDACQKGDYATAIPIFEQLAVDEENMASRTFFAECLVKKKEWVRATELCDSVIEKAQIIQRSGVSPANVKIAKDREEWAHQVCDPVRPLIPKLQFIVSGEEERIEKLRILLDGKPIHPSRWKKTILVDPGSHRIEPRLSREGVLAPTEAYARDTQGEGIVHPVYIHVPDAPQRFNLSNGLQQSGIGFTVLGAASIVTSGVFFTMAAMDYQNSNASGTCPGPANKPCTGEGYRLRESGYWNAVLGTYFLMGGGGALALGITSTLIGRRLENSKIDDGRKISFFLAPWGVGAAGSF